MQLTAKAQPRACGCAAPVAAGCWATPRRPLPPTRVARRRPLCLRPQVHEATIAAGAYPSPYNYYNYPKSVCTSINEIICHGIPDRRPLQDGDIVNVDVSVYYKGYHGAARDLGLPPGLPACVARMQGQGRRHRAGPVGRNTPLVTRRPSCRLAPTPIICLAMP